MTSERAEQPAAPEQHHSGPGKALAAQREAMGWTVEQVADQLKLAVRQVIALEAGNYAALPSPAVTRGFVRAYAKILKLDAAPLVAQIAMDSPVPADTGAASVRRDKPASFSEVRFPTHGRRSKLPLGWIGAAIVVAVAAGAAWQFGLIPLPHGETATTAAPAPAAASAPAASASAPEPLLDASVPLISVPAPVADGAAAPAATTPGAPAAGTQPAAAPAAAGVPHAAAPAQSAAAPVAAPVQPAAAAGPNALVFTVSQDAWIDVRPAKGGKPLISRLVKAGSTETINVTEPVKVVVGNTHGVTATLRGTAVALPGLTARINLQ